MGKEENKYKGNAGVHRVHAFTLKSKGAGPEQNI